MQYLVAVVVEQGHHLGAGEQPVGDLDGLAGSDGDAAAAIVGLVAVALDLVAEAGLDRQILLGHQRRQPVFVGDAEPAAGAGELDIALFGDVLVLPLLEPAVQRADRALVQDVVAQRRRRAPAAEQAVGIERHRLAGVVGDRPLDREHVVGVELEPLGEGQAGTVVPVQRHRVRGRELRTLGVPERLGAGQRRAGVADPAIFGEVGVRRTRRAEQHDLGRVRVHGLAVALQGDVVDPAALERDRAVDGAVVDPHPRRSRERRPRGSSAARWTLPGRRGPHPGAPGAVVVSWTCSACCAACRSCASRWRGIS